MHNYKTIILTILSSVFFNACTKHETLPDLDARSIPPPPPIVYSFGSNVMVKLDSSTIKPWGTTTSFVLAVYVSVKDSILSLYGSKYSKITVYGYNYIGNLPSPIKTFSKVVNSGQVFKYSFGLVDTANIGSVMSPQYTITIP